MRTLKITSLNVLDWASLGDCPSLEDVRVIPSSSSLSVLDIPPPTTFPSLRTLQIRSDDTGYLSRYIIGSSIMPTLTNIVISIDRDRKPSLSLGPAVDFGVSLLADRSLLLHSVETSLNDHSEDSTLHHLGTLEHLRRLKLSYSPSFQPIVLPTQCHFSHKLFHPSLQL